MENILNRTVILLPGSCPRVGLGGAGGVKNFSVGIGDGAPSTARSSVERSIHVYAYIWALMPKVILILCHHRHFGRHILVYSKRTVLVCSSVKLRVRCISPIIFEVGIPNSVDASWDGGVLRTIFRSL